MYCSSCKRTLANFVVEQTRNIVQTMEYYEVEPMFALTVGLGLTAFIMAWEILAIALKAWAVKRENPPQISRYPYAA